MKEQELLLIGPFTATNYMASKSLYSETKKSLEGVIDLFDAMNIEHWDPMEHHVIIRGAIPFLLKARKVHALVSYAQCPISKALVDIAHMIHVPVSYQKYRP